MRRFLFPAFGILALIATYSSSDAGGAGGKRQELPHGATMPLGKLQEDMHLGESLPISAERELAHGRWA